MTEEEAELLDARLRPIFLDLDWLIDDRGLTYKPMATQNTLRKQGIVNAQLFHDGQPKGETTYLHADQVFYVTTLFSTKEGNRSLYKSLYEQFVRPRRRAELRERKSKIPRIY